MLQIMLTLTAFMVLVIPMGHYLYHNLARFSMPKNPDIFRVVQYIMPCEAG